MQFNSFIFILAFLPVTVLLYHMANRIFLRTATCMSEFPDADAYANAVRTQRKGMIPGKLILLLAGIIFYAYSDWTLLIIMGISLAVNYLFAFFLRKVSTCEKECVLTTDGSTDGKSIDDGFCKHLLNHINAHRQRCLKILLAVPVVINIGLLLLFKYLNFAITNFNIIFHQDISLRNLILPVGISFFTFQQIAYVVSSYRGEIKDTGLLDYLVYILYFPKLLMGPLMEPVDFLEQLNDAARKRFNWDNMAFGLQIFSLGLFKKAMIADVFAGAAVYGFSNPDEEASMFWMLTMLFYTFEIYFDFSGYSDMATGASLLLNIELPINFDSPYKAISIRDFWKRWHISLTKFFTKYIYIPLGGNRKGILFTCVNTMIVFLISGLWHGANWTFVLWGGCHGLLCVLERLLDKYLKRIFEPARWLVTFGIVNVLWLLFRSDSISRWVDILLQIICFQNMNVSDKFIAKFTLPEQGMIANLLSLSWSVENIRGFWMLIYIAAAVCICLFFENNYKKLKDYSWFSMIIAAVAFIWSFLSLGEESVFVYFNF